MNLYELLSSNINIPIDSSFKNIFINSIEQDHRLVTKGSLFICIKGNTTDGHNYIDKAIMNGAVAIIAEKKITLEVPVIVVENTATLLPLLANKFYKFPSRDLEMVGITGTNGKTTTSKIIEHLLEASKRDVGIIGTLYTKYKNYTKPSINTTPDSLTLQKTLFQMKEAGLETVVMEVSSHALALKRSNGCDFDIAVFTNLQPEHLDFHPNMEDYLQAKSLLFSQLGSYLEKKIAIINNDDAAANFLIAATQAQVITYGIMTGAHVHATEITQGVNGTHFTCHTPFGSFQTFTNLSGRFNLYNVLASIATAIALKIDLPSTLKAIGNIPIIPGRFENVSTDQDFSIIVDFAHTADSLDNILNTLNELPHNNIYTVVGCGGDRDPSKRHVMAKIAAKKSTHAFFTSDNPRTESQDQIFSHMKQGVCEMNNYTFIKDRRSSIEIAIKTAQKGDIILIAGKGHETYQIIGNEKIHFDDKEVALNIIKTLVKQ